MRISVVIATYNREPLLRRTLPLVFEQDFPSNEFEVIVVNDGSSDATESYLASLTPRCGFKYLSQKNAGQAAAINAGLAAASGEIIVFLDDDIECSAKVLQAHSDAHGAEINRLVFGPVLIHPEQKPSLAVDWVRIYCDDYFADLNHSGLTDRGWYFAFGNANSSGRREMIQASGGLNPDLIRSNDLEFGYRLYLQGAKFTYAPEALVYQRWAKPLRTITIDEPKLEGIAEVTICRAHPSYRRHSRLAAWASGSWWRRTLRKVLVWMPVNPAPLFSLMAGALSPFRGWKVTRKIGIAFLRLALGTSMFRSAIKFAGGWKVFREEFGRRLPVLMYHRVGDPKPGQFHSLSITAKTFEGQLEWLKRHGYTVIAPERWVRWVKLGEPLPKKPVVITIDDAYEDLEEYALPLLEKYQYPTTIYVVTDELGGSNRWDQANGFVAMRLMSADQIRKWAGRGFQFGAHSRNHPDLRTLTDEQIREELEQSKLSLERVLGVPVTSFAYPYGFLDERSTKIASEIFETSFTCFEGVNDASVPLELLRRTSMEPAYSFVDPGPRLWWGFNPMQRLRLYIGLARRRAMKILMPSRS